MKRDLDDALQVIRNVAQQRRVMYRQAVALIASGEAGSNTVRAVFANVGIIKSDDEEGDDEVQQHYTNEDILRIAGRGTSSALDKKMMAAMRRNVERRPKA